MNGLKLTLAIPLLCVSSLLFAVHGFSETAIIVHPDNPISSLSAQEIEDIFLGKNKRFSNGNAIIPIEQNENNPIRSLFIKSIMGKSDSQVKAYWARIIFTGKGQPPKQVNSDSDVIKMVAQDPSTIGYIDASSVNNLVKVVNKF